MKRLARSRIPDSVFERELTKLAAVGLIESWSEVGRYQGGRRRFTLRFPGGASERWEAAATYAFILGATMALERGAA